MRRCCTRARSASALGRWLGGRTIEVTASAELAVPSRLPEPEPSRAQDCTPPAELLDYRAQVSRGLAGCKSASHRWSSNWRCNRRGQRGQRTSCGSGCRAAGVSESTRRALAGVAGCGADLRSGSPCRPRRQRLRQIVEAELPIRGPIQLAAPGRRSWRLVGPTGVGKTTTIAKLAANFRLREKRRVGLITVDTYRIAAVEQLRTYAEIMDLPMEVVATPREMREAVERLADRDLVLIDTAGRSPHDDVRIARAADAAGRGRSRRGAPGAELRRRRRQPARRRPRVCRRRRDEPDPDQARRGGAARPAADWLAACRLPLSYTTHGQNVPDDIQPGVGARGWRELLISELLTSS